MAWLGGMFVHVGEDDQTLVSGLVFQLYAANGPNWNHCIGECGHVANNPI